MCGDLDGLRRYSPVYKVPETQILRGDATGHASEHYMCMSEDAEELRLGSRRSGATP